MTNHHRPSITNICTCAIFIVCTLAFGFLSSNSKAIGQEPTKDKKDEVVKKRQRVAVVSEDGKPIANAKIQPFGLNRSYFWPIREMGEAGSLKTDDQGIVELEYPEMIGGKVRTTSIDCMVSHPEFVGAVARIPVRVDEDSKVTLKNGVRVRIAPVDEDGKPVTAPISALLSGDTPPDSWIRDASGSIETKSIPVGNHQLLIVLPMPDGKTRFSEILSFHFDDKDLVDGVLIDDVELTQGVRVFGRLPDDIPRPIKNGWVQIVQFPLPLQGAANAGLEMLHWAERAPIDKDGNFEFPSLPASGRIQLIALCDGWVSPGENVFTKGTTVQVTGSDLEVDLEMMPTMDAHLEIVDENDQPIENAEIYFSPNQLWADWGSQILGEQMSTLNGIEIQLKLIDESKQIKFRRAETYSGKTDAQGKCSILNLPLRSSHSFGVGKKGVGSKELTLEPPTTEAGESRQISRQKITLTKDDDE